MEKVEPWVTQYGPDPDSWNLGEDFDEGDGSNMPGINVVAETMAYYLAQNPDADRSVEALAELICIPVTMVQPALDAGVKAADPKNAILNWVNLRGNSDTTVADAALVFMLEPSAIMKLVEDGYWSFLSGDLESGDPTKITIEMDGI